MAGEGGSKLPHARKPAVQRDSENRGGNSKETSNKLNHDRRATGGRGGTLAGRNLTGEQTRKGDHDGGGTGTSNKHKDKAAASSTLVTANPKGKEEQKKSYHDGSGTGTGKHTHQPVAVRSATLADGNPMAKEEQKRDHNGRGTGQSASGKPSERKTR